MKVRVWHVQGWMGSTVVTTTGGTKVEAKRDAKRQAAAVLLPGRMVATEMAVAQ